LVPGKDYGIVGFDDWHREAHLTSLRPPLDQMGEEGLAWWCGCARRSVRDPRGPAAPVDCASSTQPARNGENGV